MIECTHWAVLEPFCENFGPNGHLLGPPNRSKLGFGGQGTTQDPSRSVLGPKKFWRKNRGFGPFLGHFVGILGPIDPSWAPKIGQNWILGTREPPRTLPECFGAIKKFAGKWRFLAIPWVFLAPSTPLGRPKSVKIGFSGPGNHPGPTPECFGAQKISRVTLILDIGRAHV